MINKIKSIDINWIFCNDRYQFDINSFVFSELREHRVLLADPVSGSDFQEVLEYNVPEEKDVKESFANFCNSQFPLFFSFRSPKYYNYSWFIKENFATNFSRWKIF